MTLCVPGPTPALCTLRHATMGGNVAPSTAQTAQLRVFGKLLGGTSLPWRFVLQANKYLVLFALAINVHPLSSCIPVCVYIAGSMLLQPHSSYPCNMSALPTSFFSAPSPHQPAVMIPGWCILGFGWGGMKASCLLRPPPLLPAAAEEWV